VPVKSISYPGYKNVNNIGLLLQEVSCPCTELLTRECIYQVVSILEEVLHPELDRIHSQLIGQVVHDILDDVVALSNLDVFLNSLI
jgi:hypothetical protein